MKRFFDNAHQRLSETEKQEMWEQLAAAQRARRMQRDRGGRRWLAGGAWRPAFAVTTVALAALGYLMFFGEHRDDLLGSRILQETAREARPDVADRSGEEWAAVPLSGKADERPPEAPELHEPPVQEIAKPAGAAGTDRDASARMPSVPAGDRKQGAAAPAPPQRETAVVPPDDERPRVAAAPPEMADALAAAPVSGIEGPAAGGKAVSGELREQARKSVEEELARKAGTVRDARELYVRGGRAGEARMRLNEVPRAAAGPAVEDVDREKSAARVPREVWTPPNDADFDAMYFQNYGVNPFVVTEEDALSTFALDVDNASYTLTRRYLQEGHLPPQEAVRVEEFVNFFAQDYPSPEGDFAIHADGAPSPFGAGYHLLRIGIAAREVAPAARRAANLVFVIDVSGSMRRESRLELVKRALGRLLDELDEGDTVGIVVYGSRGRVVLEPTGADERARITAAIAALQPEGSTNAEEGLELGYRMARQHYDTAAVNRLILCSDGVANQGRTGAESILEQVRHAADEGIQLSTIGFGLGNYNDVLLEQLADRGDGNYYYVDNLQEAERVFHENLTGTLQTVGEEVKVQVEFDPARVLRYRLLGYENRNVADWDFRNDAVDAGEVGAGHQVTALYEIKLADAAARHLERSTTDRDGGRARSPHLAMVRLRYRQPARGRAPGDVHELKCEITTRDLSRSFAEAPLRLQLDAAVAEFAEILRGSYWARGSTLRALAPQVDDLADRLHGDRDVQELRALVQRAAELEDED